MDKNHWCWQQLQSVAFPWRTSPAQVSHNPFHNFFIASKAMKIAKFKLAEIDYFRGNEFENDFVQFLLT